MFDSVRSGWSTHKKLMFLKAAAAVPAVEATATGNPLTFITDLAKPLKSLLIPFTPKQSGTGDPSPQNIRPILPWNGLTVFGGGKNLLNTDGIVHNSYNIGGFVNTLKPNTKYTISINGTTVEAYRLYMTTESAPLSGTTPVSKGYIFAGQKETFTTPSEMTGILVLAGNSAGAGNVPIDSILPMIEAGETATAYEPFKPITDTDIVFPSPVYGGEHEAVSGKLMDGWKAFDLGKLSWNVQNNGNIYYFVAILPSSVYLNMWTPGQIPEANNYPPHFVSDRFKTVAGAKIPTGNSGDNCVGMDWISAIRIRCDMYNHDASAFKTAMDGVMIYYELATPQEIQLTPTQLTAIKGNNTIWSDANGTMTVTFLKKK